MDNTRFSKVERYKKQVNPEWETAINEYIAQNGVTQLATGHESNSYAMFNGRDVRDGGGHCGRRDLYIIYAGNSVLKQFKLLLKKGETVRIDGFINPTTVKSHANRLIGDGWKIEKIKKNNMIVAYKLK